MLPTSTTCTCVNALHKLVRPLCPLQAFFQPTQSSQAYITSLDTHTHLRPVHTHLDLYVHRLLQTQINKRVYMYVYIYTCIEIYILGSTDSLFRLLRPLPHSHATKAHGPEPQAARGALRKQAQVGRVGDARPSAESNQ